MNSYSQALTIFPNNTDNSNNAASKMSKKSIYSTWINNWFELNGHLIHTCTQMAHSIVLILWFTLNITNQNLFAIIRMCSTTSNLQKINVTVINTRALRYLLLSFFGGNNLTFKHLLSIILINHKVIQLLRKMFF